MLGPLRSHRRRPTPKTEELPKYHIIRRRTEVQGSNMWPPPGGTLAEILEETRIRLRTPWRAPSTSGNWATRPSLTKALRRPSVAVIAELKRRSPSKGSLNESLSAKPYATMVEDAGAAAISVLTEPRFFNGSMRDLWDVAGSVRIPVLKKDFHIEPSQLRDAITGGASA